VLETTTGFSYRRHPGDGRGGGIPFIFDTLHNFANPCDPTLSIQTGSALFLYVANRRRSAEDSLLEQHRTGSRCAFRIRSDRCVSHVLSRARGDGS
jgi:hypothetical protein